MTGLYMSMLSHDPFETWVQWRPSSACDQELLQQFFQLISGPLVRLIGDRLL